MSVLVLVVAGALFLFYIQTICEKALRREFSRPYFKNVIQAIQLEYPQLRSSLAEDGPFNYGQARLALKCDFFTLEYMLKNGGLSRPRRACGERLLGLYFRFLLFRLSVRHAFRLQEREVVLKLVSVLQYFANSLGEELSAGSFVAVTADIKS
jgi:hypothetical protein